MVNSVQNERELIKEGLELLYKEENAKFEDLLQKVDDIDNEIKNTSSALIKESLQLLKNKIEDESSIIANKIDFIDLAIQKYSNPVSKDVFEANEYKYSNSKDMSNTRPLSFSINGETFIANTWKDILVHFLTYLYSLNSDKFKSLVEHEYGVLKKVENNTLSYFKLVQIDNYEFKVSSLDVNRVISALKQFTDIFNLNKETFIIKYYKRK